MRRRPFLRNIGVVGACGWATAIRIGWAQSPQPWQRPFLNELRDKIHAYTESLWDDKEGGFRQNAEIGVNLLSTTDVAWLRYATNDPDIGGKHRDRCPEPYQSSFGSGTLVMFGSQRIR
jgi:hypothetical protein